MKNNLKIIIACGSGCCTSTLCKNVISELAADENIPADVTTCSSLELDGIYKNYDVHFTTMPYKFSDDIKYCMNVFPLVTGMGVGKCKESIRELLHKAMNEE